VLARGVTRRCPVCGQGGLFRHWFHMVERCPRCELRFERVEGHWLGSLGLNVMVSFATLFVVLVVGFVVTYPEPPVGPLIAIGLVVALVLPLVFFPFSKTLWTAIDVLMRPLHPDEVRPEYRILDRE
jgi:uncharacterized protein (DUF983 family)